MKDAPYFKHDFDSRNDPKMIDLRRKYGAKGYGIYFMIIEMLRSNKKYSMKLNLESIAFDIKEDIEVIEDIIKNYGLFRITMGSFYSPSLKQRMKTLDKIREGWRLGGKKRWEGKDGDKSIYKEFQG